MPYTLKSDFKPGGDQPEAIKQLVEGIERGDKYQTLLGVTGSGKTFTISNVIAQFDKPVLVMSHNNTLAAQLYAEFKQFFPNNPVEFFISYYDYYQPEAYVPQTDTYIEKDSAINDEIDRLRLRATSALMSYCGTKISTIEVTAEANIAVVKIPQAIQGLRCLVATSDKHKPVVMSK